MKTLAKVVVGSRLHGLDNPKSDWDYRGIHIHDLKDVLSPFQTLKNTSWIEGDIDDTSYELSDFCKMATRGNATYLEVFFSNQIIETSPIHKEMQENWIKFLDTDAFAKASLGYAHNQKNKFEDRDPVGVKGQFRRHKFAVAYSRVMWQCTEFMKTGEFKCQIDEGEFKNQMLRWKNEWNDSFTMEAIETYYRQEAELEEAWQNTKFKYKPDIEWIEDFILRAYKGE
jgi:predicted nucleotidyltransferase